jgi:hypothetical protein
LSGCGLCGHGFDIDKKKKYAEAVPPNFDLSVYFLMEFRPCAVAHSHAAEHLGELTHLANQHAGADVPKPPVVARENANDSVHDEF